MQGPGHEKRGDEEDNPRLKRMLESWPHVLPMPGDNDVDALHDENRE